MTLFDYHWDKIGWKGFEEMCLYLAECILFERRFEIYGRTGEEQDGIDILSKNEKGESVICIQCKRYEKMDLATLKEIINKFETNDFIHSAKSFVIATRASLKARNLVRHINAEKIRFQEKYKIAFETWDVHYIEKELSNHYSLTCKYFGVEVAETIWSGKVEVPIAFNRVEDYIDRTVIPYKDLDGDSHIKWLMGSRELTNVTNLFTKQLPGSKKYCLIADAYQGKTTLFEQVAYELFYHKLKLFPILLKIKEYNHRSLIDTLDITHRWWRSVPIKQLVVIIDGLDEVDAGRFLDSVKNINELSTSYPSLPILFSCRKLFFNHEQVQSLLKDFSYYELYPIQQDQVERYISAALLGEESQFLNHIERYDLRHFLYHPFYLRNLVKIFKEDRGHLPKSRTATVEYFINESFTPQATRQLANGTILKRKQKVYNTNLKKAAFAMQLRGTNVLTDEEVQVLFPNNDDIELLKQGSVLTFSDEKWSFQNAIFQEYLSALVLEKLSFSQIQDIVCIGDQIKKIKTKWIQTLVGVLSVLQPNDERKDGLFQMLRKDNIELITLCDSYLLSLSDRIGVLNQLIRRYDELGLRPMVVYEDTIGRFFRGMPGALDILIDVLTTSGSYHLKRIVWRILQYIDFPPSHQNRVLEIALQEICKSSDGSYVDDILYTLIHYRMGSKDFVKFLIDQHQLNKQLNYRDKVYDMIVQLDLGEDFYDYGIEGVEVIFTTPTDSFMRSERSLEEILLSARSRYSIEKLFRIINSDQWVNFRGYNYSGDESFMLRLSKLCERLHREDALMIFTVIYFIKDLGRKHRRDDFKEIDHFFVNTGTSNFVIRYFLHMPDPNVEWDLGTLLTTDAFGFLFDYYEEGYIESEFILRLIHSAYYYGHKEVMMELNKLYVGATGREDTYQIAQERQREREAFETLKRQNDLRYIRNQVSFSEGTKKYFEAYGKKSIPEDDIIIDHELVQSSRRESDSYFISNFILYQIRNRKPVTLSHCLKAIANQDYFDHFRIREILSYPTLNEPSNEELKSLLKQLYDAKIPHADFISAIKQNGEEIKIFAEEVLLQQIFEKMEFSTEPSILIDMLCMDMSGLQSFKQNSILSNRKPSLSETIISKLTPQQVKTAKTTILNRLREGIKVKAVMETHVSLCGFLLIYETKDLILTLMIEKKVRSYHIFIAAEIFLDLGGELEQLLPVLEGFDQYGDHAYYQLILKLKEDYPDDVRRSLLRALKATEISLSKRIDFAQLLIEIGEVEGFNFIVEQMQGIESLPWGRDDSFKLQKIDTKFVLEKLSPQLHLVLDDKDSKGARKDVRSIIVNFLFSLATKSEEDLLLADHFLQDAEARFTGRYPDLSILRWYRERIVENFRDTDKGHNSLEETKGIISKFEDIIS